MKWIIVLIFVYANGERSEPFSPALHADTKAQCEEVLWSQEHLDAVADLATSLNKIAEDDSMHVKSIAALDCVQESVASDK